jgi:hypothetical protein
MARVGLCCFEYAPQKSASLPHMLPNVPPPFFLDAVTMIKPHSPPWHLGLGLGLDPGLDPGPVVGLCDLFPGLGTGPETGPDLGPDLGLDPDVDDLDLDQDQGQILDLDPLQFMLMARAMKAQDGLSQNASVAMRHCRYRVAT